MLSNHQPCFLCPFILCYIFVLGGDERTINQPLVMVIMHVCMVKQL